MRLNTRFFHPRILLWSLIIMAGAAAGIGATVIQERKQGELELRDRQIEEVFKNTYLRWLDAGGRHRIPREQHDWEDLQNDLFRKWTSPAGQGDPLGLVKQEVAGVDGDPAAIRLPNWVQGRIEGDYIIVTNLACLRLRAWSDGTIGWRCTRE